MNMLPATAVFRRGDCGLPAYALKLAEQLQRRTTMKTASGNGAFQVKRVFTKNMMLVVFAPALLLLVPLVAMQFTNEVAWTLSDFVVAGALLVGTSLAYVVSAKKVSTKRQRIFIGAALALALFLVWVQLAVGIVGS